MRRLLVIGFLLCSGIAAAQTDDRRIRTVQIDEGQVRAGPADERRVRAPERPVQPDDHRDGAAQPSDQGDDAEQPDDNLALARQLVDLGADSASPPEPSASCVPAAEAMRADIVAAYRANPADFHGISPRSAYWPDVERIWRNYYVARCTPQGPESPAAIIARTYAANLSTVELRELVAFQESPTGRAFIAATRLARQDLDSAPAAPAAQRDTDEASDNYRNAMLRLKAKYDRAPK